jgi:hypothetical protein
MLSPDEVNDIQSEEQTARFVFSKRHVRADRTLKGEAFLPHPYEDLSVTRLIQTTPREVSAIGYAIAAKRNPPRNLQGQGEVLANTYIRQHLQVVVAPVEGNPNHANVNDWPTEKAQQLLIAKEIARVARFVAPVDNEQA